MAARRALTALAVAVALAAPQARADEVPAPLALMVMLKVLTYDTGFSTRGSGDFLVAVPFAPGQQASADALVNVASHLDLHSINGRELKFLAVAAGDVPTVKGASAVLLHAGLAVATAKEALQGAAKARLYSLALDEPLVHEGALLSVTVNGGRPQVVVNTVAARSLGVELSPTVLRVAKTVQ